MGDPADVMRPNAGLPTVTFGLLNCGVFSRLKNSARNSSQRASEKRNFLNVEKSICFVPGPCRILRPALPNSRKPGLRNADVSIHRLILRWSSGSEPLPTRSGRELQQFVVLGELRSKGSPSESVTIPFTCHPPSAVSFQPLN